VGITELHRTLDSPVNFGPGEEAPHLGSGAAHRRAASIAGISGTAPVPERQATSQEKRANDPLKQSLGVVLEKLSGKTGDSAEDIGSDASRHHRQPRYHRRAELIGERRSVADVKP